MKLIFKYENKFFSFDIGLVPLHGYEQLLAFSEKCAH